MLLGLVAGKKSPSLVDLEMSKKVFSIEINCNGWLLNFIKSFAILLLIRYHLLLAVHVDLKSKIGIDSYLILEQ